MNVVLHRANLDRLGEIIDMAAGLGADRIELANTQYYGWALAQPRGADADAGAGRARAKRSPSDAMRALSRDRCRSSTCCPTTTSEYPKACHGGWGSSISSSRPTAARCHATVPRRSHAHFDNVREHSLEWIWQESAAFQRLSRRRLDEGAVPQLPAQARGFGGCRCQAFALTGDAANADPVCTLSPDRAIDRRRAIGEPPDLLEYRYRTLAIEPQRA